MVSVVLLTGLLIGVVASGLASVDMRRRELTPRTYYFWTGGVALVSIGGPLTVFLFDNLLYQLYSGLTGGSRIALLPREIALIFITFSLIAGCISVLAYGIGSRYGPLKVA